MVISALTEASDHIWASVALAPATENAAEQQQAAAPVNTECKKGRWETEKDERTGRQLQIEIQIEIHKNIQGSKEMRPRDRYAD